jgi:hypothetical protein
MVGPLRIHLAGRDDVRAFAGRPDRIFDLSDLGKPRVLWRYRFRGGRQTTYELVQVDGNWRFEGFFTSTRRFRTRRGTTVGMSWGEARRRERGAAYAHAGCLPPRLWYFKEGGFKLQLFLSAERPQGRVTGLQVPGPFALECD